MSGALLNLVRKNVKDVTAPDSDYTSGETFERHEVIDLVDPTGEPCAIPQPTKNQNIDYGLSLITGGKAFSLRGIIINISIYVDYIRNSLSRLLERWTHERAEVWVAPNIGQGTVFSYRPIHQLGANWPDGTGAVYDLTGNYLTVFRADTSHFPLMWDYQKSRFGLKPIGGFGPITIYNTPGGGGLKSTRSVQNRMVPGYPKSATASSTAGNAGWEIAGSDAGQISFTYVAGGFGHPDCPDYITVDYTGAISGNRWIQVQNVWNPAELDYGGYTFTGAGTMTVCVWLRGKLPTLSVLSIAHGTGVSRTLFGERLDGWTPVMISMYSADWSTAIPWLTLSLGSDEANAGSFDLACTNVNQASGVSFPVGALWTEDGTATGTTFLETNSNFIFPDSGTIIVSFMVPDEYGQAYGLRTIFGFLGNDQFGFYGGNTSAGAEFIELRDGGNVSSHSMTGITTYKAGKINTAAFTWGTAAQSLYVNGVYIGDVDRDTDKITLGDNDSPLIIGYMDSGFNHSIFPGSILTARVDEGDLTAGEIMNTHLALTDSIALKMAIDARGRTYRIKQTPSMLRDAADGSDVLGVVGLEQVQYDDHYADPVNKETNLP